MEAKFIGKWQGIDVVEVPDEIFKGPLVLPPRFIKYLKELEDYKNKNFIQTFNDIMARI